MLLYTVPLYRRGKWPSTTMTDRHRTKSPPAPARHNIAPDPPGGFAAITAIPKLIGPFAQRDTP